jgi:hypothetical protein
MDLRDGRKETTSCNEATETKLNPGLMQSIDEHQDITKEEAAVMPVGELRTQRGVCNLVAELRQKWKERTRENRDKRGSRLPPAGRFSPLQNWADEKGNSSGRIGSRKTVNHGRNWSSPAERGPTVQKWCGARGTSLEVSGPGPRLSERSRRRGRATKAERG